MAITPISKPGTQIFQSFTTASTVIVKPKLPAVVVGVAKQVVEAVDDAGLLNSDAFLSLPAQILFPFVAPGSGYTGVPGTTFQFSVNNGPAVTYTFPASGSPTPAGLKAFVTLQGTAGLVASVEASGGQERLVLKTTATGQYASLKILGGTLLAIAPMFDAFGEGGLSFVGLDGYNNARAASILFAGYPDPRSNLDELSVEFDTVRTFLDTGASFREVSRTQAFLRGDTAGVAVVDDGDGDNLSPYLEFTGALFTASPAVATVTGTTAVTSFVALVGNLGLSIGGGAEQLIDLAGLTTGAAVVTAINEHLGALVASISGTALVLTATDTFGGSASSVEVTDTSSSDVLTKLGLTVGVVEGDPHPVAVGDEVWIDGIRKGLVTEVVTDSQLRLDTELLLSYTGASYYINALGLSNSPASSLRPGSELLVDEESGTVQVTPGLFRDTAGVRTVAQNLGMYLGYTALRKDVSAAGTNFNLLRIGTVAELEAALSPIDTQNPLGLGMLAALKNAPGFEILGLGIDETSTTAPEGTDASWERALSYLESKEVYAIAAMTHSKSVGDLLDTHVTLMSKPENGLERICLLNPLRPTHKSNLLVASGALGNAVSGSSTVDTGIANLPALIAAAGIGVGPYDITDNLFIEMEQDVNKYLILSVSGSQVTVSAAADIVDNDDEFYFEGSGAPAFATAIVDRPFSVAVRGALLADLTDEATAYGELAQAYGNRRTVVTAPDTAVATIDGLETLIEGYYATAALAGLTAASSASAPFTNVTLEFITGVHGSNDRYGELQLKITDGGGLWSFVQEEDGVPVTTRHQLTSDMSSIEKREYSIVKAVDFTAKLIRQATKNFSGRFNLTLGVQDSLSTVFDGLENFLVDNAILGSFRTLNLGQSEDYPDRIVGQFKLGVLYPINDIILELVI